MTVLAKLWTTHRKYAVGLLGVLSQAVSLGLLSGNALHIAQLAVAFLTAEGVRLVSNTPAGPLGGL
jgi:hypothetical protein